MEIIQATQCQLCIDDPSGNSCDCSNMTASEIEQAHSASEQVILSEGEDEIESLSGMFVLGIDPGHEGVVAGMDPGATGHGEKEANFVMKVSKALYNIMNTEYHNTKAVLTRDGDKYQGVNEKARLFNQWGVSYGLSIHANSHSNPSSNGYEDFSYNGPISAVSLNAQKVINQEMAKALPELRNRGAKRANLGMVRIPLMPASLIEIGFISNQREANLMKSQDFINRSARGLANGVARAFSLKKKDQFKDKPAPAKPATPKPAPSKPAAPKKPSREEVSKSLGGSLREDALRAYDAGITDGSRPGDTITRGEVMAMFGRMLKK